MTFQVAEALKMSSWERAKGELEALVALQGSHACTDLRFGEKHAKLKAKVEKFIKQVEEHDLYS